MVASSRLVQPATVIAVVDVGMRVDKERNVRVDAKKWARLDASSVVYPTVETKIIRRAGDVIRVRRGGELQNCSQH